MKSTIPGTILLPRHQLKHTMAITISNSIHTTRIFPLAQTGIHTLKALIPVSSRIPMTLLLSSILMTVTVTDRLPPGNALYWKRETLVTSATSFSEPTFACSFLENTVKLISLVCCLFFISTTIPCWGIGFRRFCRTPKGTSFGRLTVRPGALGLAYRPYTLPHGPRKPLKRLARNF